MEQIVTIHSIDKIDKAAQSFLKAIGDNRVIAFSGELGAGKTTFIKALCRQLNVVSEVTSPSFSIINEYHTSGGNVIFHLDFYRIVEETEVYDIGYEDYLYSGYFCFIEWPERISNLLPEDTMFVTIFPEEDGSRSIKRL
jgi:tRNA threonylcarbamoyladenosine biosynthesis protein TsaE